MVDAARGRSGPALLAALTGPVPRDWAQHLLLRYPHLRPHRLDLQQMARVAILEHGQACGFAWRDFMDAVRLTYRETRTASRRHERLRPEHEPPAARCGCCGLARIESDDALAALCRRASEPARQLLTHLVEDGLLKDAPGALGLSLWTVRQAWRELRGLVGAPVPPR